MSLRARLTGTLAGRVALLIVLTIAMSAIASGFFVSHDVKREINSLTMDNLRTSVLVIAKLLDPGWADHGTEMPISQRELEGWAYVLGARITIIGTDGTVRADSSVPPDSLAALDNHRDRPEVSDALSGGAGVDMRRSETTREPYIYYALLDRTEGGDGYVIRCSLPQDRFYGMVSRVRGSIAASLLLAGAAALAVGIVGARRVTRPIRMLIAASRAAKEGKRAIYPAGGAAEIDELSRTLRESARAQSKMMSDLRDERNELETVVQSAPCGLMMLDAGGRISRVNVALAPLLREPPEDAAGRRADGALRSPELIELIASARDGGDGSAGKSSETGFAFRHNGTELFFKARAVPTATGELLVVLDDETERKRMEMARKSFVADAGHEFQTPLTSISAAAELLASMPDSTHKERAPYIEEIARQRKRMTALVDDLLLLSRLESGVPTCQSEDFDLAELCRELVDDARKNPLASGIEWSVSLPGGRIAFNGRKKEIGRSISNLLDNAVKYTRKRFAGSGGGITVSLAPEGAECVLHIGDNGIGIPRDKLAGIFGRFERAETDRSRGGESNGGYGLGLAIAKTAIESHGGRIDAKSSGDSTDFFVRLKR
jgi:two-component system phosphate regulon sensor histidine kinase PhoR